MTDEFEDDGMREALERIAELEAEVEHLRETLTKLADAADSYRRTHNLKGYESAAAARAWVILRQQTQEAREALGDDNG